MPRIFLSETRNCPKKRILHQDEGGSGFRTAGIRRCSGDSKAGPNIWIGSKGFFKPASGSRRFIGTGLQTAICLMVILCAWTVPTPHAYVLEGPHVLDLMVQRLSGAKTLRVLQNVEIQDADVTQHPVELAETLSYIYPNRFRSDAWYQGTNRIYVASFGQFLTVIDTQITSNKEGRFERYIDPLLHQTRTAMLKSLLAAGIDVGITSLGKIEASTAFVIGAQYPDSSVSQLWVDKESFLPLRLIIVEKGSGDGRQRLEFVYRNWQSFGKTWYPMLIETYRDDILLRRAQARNVMVNNDFSPQLLDIANLIGLYGTEGQGQKQERQPDTDDVQRTIDDFRKKFEP